MSARSRVPAPLRWRRTPVLALSAAGALLLGAAGAALSRPDIVAVGMPLALAAAWAMLRRPIGDEAAIELSARDGGPDDPEGTVRGTVGLSTGAPWVQLAVDQGENRTGLADTVPGAAALRSRSRLRHSGPVELIAVTARAVDHDGAWTTDPLPRVRLEWSVPPQPRPPAVLPVAPRLSCLHGAHEGARPGQGGDFRDIHRFAPGDELRRVDWRATARLSRRPGDLFVRRTNTLSESSVVIAVDTADDLGEVVATWGEDAPETSGVTSLDIAREAALSIATTAVEQGDRVAYHVLAPGGRTVRSGAGARHLARLRDVVAATGVAGDGSRFRRTPPVPHGSIVFVLSTFFDGAAAELATRWRASGHAVVAVDVLPAPDASRLTREQRVAMRTLLTERADVLVELDRVGVDVLSWGDGDADARLRASIMRRRRHGGGVG